MELDLDCSVCSQSATLTDVTPVTFEHAASVWRDLHQHTGEERAAWYDALAVAGSMDDDQ